MQNQLGLSVVPAAKQCITQEKHKLFANHCFHGHESKRVYTNRLTNLKVFRQRRLSWQAHPTSALRRQHVLLKCLRMQLRHGSCGARSCCQRTCLHLHGDRTARPEQVECQISESVSPRPRHATLCTCSSEIELQVPCARILSSQRRCKDLLVTFLPSGDFSIGSSRQRG